MSKKKKSCVGEIPCPYSRLGGKCRIAQKIVPYFPEHDRYIEPFLGSAAIFLNKCRVDEEIVSDLEDSINQIMRNIKKSGKTFDVMNEKKPFDFQTNKAKWTRFYKTLKSGSSVQRLYKSLYVMLNSWSGNGRAWGGKKRLGKVYKRKLALHQERLKKTKILKQDYKKVIQKYDRKGAFIYLDPPYDVATINYYGRIVDLEEMRDILLKVKGKFLLSIDITENTKKLFLHQKFHSKRIRVLYTAGGVRRYKYEYLISNYPLKK